MDEAYRGIRKKLTAGPPEAGFGGGSARFGDVRRGGGGEGRREVVRTTRRGGFKELTAGPPEAYY